MIYNAKCPKCNNTLVIKENPRDHAYFIGCKNYPNCNYTSNFTITDKCPKCGKNLVIRENQRNHTYFIGCNNYPECKYTEDLIAKT